MERDSLLEIAKRRIIRELIGSVRRSEAEAEQPVSPVASDSPSKPLASAAAAAPRRPAQRPEDAWYVLVVDKRALRIISAALRMFDVMEEHITDVQDIAKSRQPLPGMQALYLLSPSPASIGAFIHDFPSRERRMYAAAHLYFTSALPQEELRRIAASPAAHYVKSLKDFNLDFLAVEPRVFHLDSPMSFQNLYSPESKSIPAEVTSIASCLVSLCLSLNEYPYVRYERHERNFPEMIAKAVQLELDKLVERKAYTPRQENRATLVVCGRTVDPMAPILMEFTYQAMAYALLPIDGDKYRYKTVSNANVEETREVVLGNHDTIWANLRHKHIADTTEWLVNTFNGFLSSSKVTQVAAKKKEVTDLKEMGEAIKAMPQYVELLSKYSLHLSIASECMAAFKRRQLDRLAEAEQNMATGEDADGREAKNVMGLVAPLLNDPAVSVEDKKRLLMLYIISQEGIKEQDRKRLFDYAKLSPADQTCISNLFYLGVTLTSGARKGKSKRKKEKRKRRGDDVPYDLSRYVPRLKNVMLDAITDQLPAADFPFVREPPAGSRLQSGEARSGLKKQAAVAKWAEQKGAEDAGLAAALGGNSPRLIVFVAGGMTHSEMRSAYEVSEQETRQCYIGSTHILTPSTFLQQLSLLKSL
eukprot:m51a1_g5892 putative sec1-like family protein (645) ;mRNA; f:529751-533189